MRWKAKRELQHGDKRIRTKFLLLPKKIDYEVRWLEFAKWEERFTAKWYEEDSYIYEWKAFRWLD